MNAARRIAAECDRVKALLLAKNASYDNSALAPLRLFASSTAVEGLCVRIDDKLSRLRHPHDAEDTELDLLGYLILLRIARSQARRRKVKRKR